MQWMKDLWSKWKVHVTVVGGALVIATAYATCTVEPADSEEVSSETTSEATDQTAKTESTTGTTGTTAGEENSNNEANTAENN